MLHELKLLPCAEEVRQTLNQIAIRDVTKISNGKRLLINHRRKILVTFKRKSKPDRVYFSQTNQEKSSGSNCCFHLLPVLFTSLAMETTSKQCHVQQMVRSMSPPSSPIHTCSPFFPDNPMPPLGPGGPCWSKCYIHEPHILHKVNLIVHGNWLQRLKQRLYTISCSQLHVFAVDSCTQMFCSFFQWLWELEELKMEIREGKMRHV